MPDPMDILKDFDAGALPPASEIRRRGDRRRRRNTALLVAGAAVLVAAVAVPVAALSGDGRTGVEPAPSPGPEVVTSIPADFPLGAGMGGDSGTPAEVGTEVPDGIGGCDATPAWVNAGTADVLAAAWTDGTEAREERVLATYDTPAGGAAAFERAAESTRDCDATDALLVPVVLEAPDLGEQAYAYAAQYLDEDGIPTGEGTAHLVVRTGTALLIDSAVFGSAGDPAVGQGEVDRLGRQALEVVGAMCAFAVGECTPPSAPDPGPTQADFPLAEGLGAAAEGPGLDVRGAENGCYSADVWPGSPAERAVARSSEPEYTRTRELNVYDTADEAVAALAGVRDSWQQCLSGADTGEGPVGRVFTEVDADTGYADSYTVTMTYTEGLGGTVFQFVRVGRAVLATSRSSEYLPETIGDDVPDLTDENTALTDLMCTYAEAGC